MAEHIISGFENPDEEFLRQMEAEAAREAAEFAYSQGYFPMELHMQPILERLSPDIIARLEQNEEELLPLEEAIHELPEIQRLDFLWQLSGKGAAEIRGEGRDMAVGIMQPAGHTRLEHCQLFAFMVKCAGAKLGLSSPELKTALLATYLHDIGHTAFSHTPEELLLEKGFNDHETRAQNMVDQKAHIQSLIFGAGVDATQTKKLMREEGAQGQLQSALDTLSYLVLDSSVTHQYLDPDLGGRLIADLRGIEMVSDRLVVGDPGIWQELLEARARMMQEVYYHPDNKRLDAAKRHLLRIAWNEGMIEPEEVIYGEDSSLMKKLQSLVQYDPGAALWSGRTSAEPLLAQYSDLYGLAVGFPVPEDWGEVEFDTLGEANLFLSNLRPQAIKQSFTTAPHDFTRKQITVVTEAKGKFEEHTLRAQETKLQVQDLSYTVYYPKSA